MWSYKNELTIEFPLFTKCVGKSKFSGLCNFCTIKVKIGSHVRSAYILDHIKAKIPEEATNSKKRIKTTNNYQK
jgi:hypothetical protein